MKSIRSTVFFLCLLGIVTFMSTKSRGETLHLEPNIHNPTRYKFEEHISGQIEGGNIYSIECINLDTGQRISSILDGDIQWDCKKYGLKAHTLDQVEIRVKIQIN